MALASVGLKEISSLYSQKLTSNGIRINTSEETFGELRSANDCIGDAIELQRRVAEDGYLLLRDFLDPELVLAARRAAVNLLAERGSIDRSAPTMDAVAAKHISRKAVLGDLGALPEVGQLMHSDRMLSFYRTLRGGEIRVFDYIWGRMTPPGNCTRPHCDIVYMGRGTQNLLSTWVPLGNVPLEQGPLAILEKSHLLPQLRSSYCQLDVDRDELWNKFRFKHGAFVREGKYSANPRAVQQEFKRRWLTTGFRATDMLVFSPYLLHCSLDNVSNRIRLTADTRYQLLSEPYDERWVGNPPVGHRNALWFLRNRN